jgi:hypothetical protein
MMLDDKMFYFTRAAAITQFLEVLLIWVMKKLINRDWKGVWKEIEVQKGYRKG